MIGIGSGGNESGLRVDFSDGIAESFCSVSDFLEGRVSHLKIAPQFITEFPEQAAGFVGPVFIDILNPLGSLCRCSGAQIERDLRFRTNQLAEPQELVRAE